MQGKFGVITAFRNPHEIEFAVNVLKGVNKQAILAVPHHTKEYIVAHSLVAWIVIDRIAHIVFEGTIFELINHHVIGVVLKGVH